MIQIYSKDSFDRFGDDLCEEIISFLDFDEKVVFECVSKQWKRSIYQKQYKLNWIVENACQLKIFNKKSKVIDIKSLEILLKKCPNLSSFSMNLAYSSFHLLRPNTPGRITVENNLAEVFQAVCKHCHNITSINYPLFLSSEESLKDLLNTFGSKLKSITLKIRGSFRPKYFKSLENIRRINFCYINDLNWLFEGKANCLVQNLTHFAAPQLDEQEEKRIQILFDCNKSLQYIKLFTDFLNLKSYESLLKGISKLTQLRALELKKSNRNNSEKVYQLFENIGKSCPNLIKLVYNERLPEKVYLKKLFQSFQYFPKLIHLKIIYGSTRFPPQDFFSDISCQSLANCQNLRRLTLLINGLTDNFFNDCDKYLTKLSCLKIHESLISSVSIDWISRLTKMRFIEIESQNTKVFKNTIKTLFNNSSKLQSVYITFLGADLYFIRTHQGNIVELSHFDYIPF